jgi:hypothetical protein
MVAVAVLVVMVMGLFLFHMKTNQGDLCGVLKGMMEDQRGRAASIEYYKTHPEELKLVEQQLEDNISRLPC